MTFMEKQVQLARWIEIDGNNGIDYVPFDVVFRTQNEKTLHPKFSDIRDYTENSEAYSIRIIDGYGARLSAPGYMDCTPWAVFETAEEAEEYLMEYDD